jgi:hypothetical protein
MTEKEKEYNDKWLLSRYLFLSLEDINKLTDYETNLLVNEINTKLNK